MTGLCVRRVTWHVVCIPRSLLFNLCVVRLSVRTLPFQGGKTGSTPVRHSRFSSRHGRMGKGVSIERKLPGSNLGMALQKGERC